MPNQIASIEKGDGPLIASALHNGHHVREEVEPLLNLSPAQRMREEDPHTARWTAVAPTRIVGLRSRFEVDLNRPRDKAIYLTPEDAWGLEVWKKVPPQDVITESLRLYDGFYSRVKSLCREKIEAHGRFVVFDLHTYNHLRDGPRGRPAEPEDNPEVNIGTGTMRRELWGRVVDRLIHDLRAFDFNGRSLDVRENVRFRGGEFPKWIHQTFPYSGCALAIEFKKTFMNEWTGEYDDEHILRIHAALEATVPGVLEELNRL